MKAKKPRVLFYDIETSPNLAYVWGKYEQDVIAFKEEWSLLSFAYKWQGEKSVEVVTASNYKEAMLVKALHTLFDSADVIIGHNSEKFDNKKVKAKFVEYGLAPPKPYKSVDTLKIARSQFAFNSNKLDDLGKILRVGGKVATGGFGLWLKCMAGDKQAWKKMARYNKQDVVLLEKVYEKLKAWAPNHPDMAVLSGAKGTCPVCTSSDVQKRGYQATKAAKKQRLQCNECSHWFLGGTIRGL